MKKLAGLLVAVVVVAAAGSTLVERKLASEGRERAGKRADEARARVRESLAAHVAQIELEVKEAAANPRLVTALRGRVDRATLEDLFRSERWWESFHAEHKMYAIAVATELRVVQGGMKGADFSADHLVREARERAQPVSEISASGGLVYVATATMVATAERAISPVLVLAKSIDDEALRKLAGSARGALLLSDGHTVLGETGGEAERELLRGAVGSEGKGTHHLQAGGAAAVDRLAPGLWMWIHASAGEEGSTLGAHAAIWGAPASSC